MMKSIASIIFMMSICVSIVRAQIALPFSGGGFDDQASLHLGFIFSYQFSHYIPELKDDWQEFAQLLPGYELQGIYPDAGMGGLSFGIPIDYSINERFDLSFRPSYTVFSRHALRYRFVDANGQTNMVEKWQRSDSQQADQLNKNFIHMDLPLLLRFKSAFKRVAHEDRIRAYILGGGRYTRFISRAAYYQQLDQAAEAMPLTVKPGYFAVEAGVGFEVYFNYFKMSPEIKWIQSVGDLLMADHAFNANPFTAPINRLNVRSVQLSLIFQ